MRRDHEQLRDEDPRRDDALEGDTEDLHFDPDDSEAETFRGAIEPCVQGSPQRWPRMWPWFPRSHQTSRRR